MIREFRPSDIGSLYDIALASLDESYQPEIFRYFHSQWPAGQLVMCLPDGTVVGFVSSVKQDMRTVRIMMLAVLPRFRSMGIGRRLMDALRARAAIEGVSVMTLEVRTTNRRAISFYTENGFLPSGTLEGFYNDGGSALRMVGNVQLNI